MTKEKLILELVQQGRLGIDDALRLLDIQPTITKFGPLATTDPKPKTATPQKRRNKKMSVISVERHFEIVRLAQQVGRVKAARRLGIPVETVAGHLRYAGLAPVGDSKIPEIQKWRKRRNLYLDTPIMRKNSVR